MDFRHQLSPLGEALSLVLILSVWSVSTVVGMVILPNRQALSSKLETVALSGPWGLMFLVGLLAAYKSGGRSMLLPIPAIQLSLLAISLAPRWFGCGSSPFYLERTNRPQDAPPSVFNPSYKTIVFAFLAFSLCAHVIYLFGLMPYVGAHRWQLPHHDYGWWGGLSWQLAQNGIESINSMTILTLDVQGNPILYWYHWLEFWLAGLVGNQFGLNAMWVLLFVVYPTFIGMLGLCCTYLVSLLSGLKRWSWLLGFVVIGAMPFRLTALQAFFPAYSLIYYTNYLFPTVLVICSIVLVAQRQHAFGGAFIALAALLSPPLFALAGPTLFLFGLWGIVNYFRQKGTLAPVAFAAIGLGLIFICFFWLLLTRHELGATRPRSDVELSVAQFVHMVYETIVFMGAAALVGFPFALGFYKLWVSSPVSGGGQSIRNAIALVVIAFVVAYPLCMLFGKGNAMHVPFLMWSAFAVPVGWCGLCKFLADGQWRPGILALMGLILSAGIVTTSRDFRHDLRFGGDFSVNEIANLRAACSGEEKIGYFEPGAKGYSVWMEPLLSSWSALLECKLIRLNRVRIDESGMPGRYWEESAPASYVRAHGLEWSNTAEVIMGFAQSCGIRMVMESKDHPIPDNILPYLDRQQQAGPFTLYKIIEVPARGR